MGSISGLWQGGGGAGRVEQGEGMKESAHGIMRFQRRDSGAMPSGLEWTVKHPHLHYT